MIRRLLSLTLIALPFLLRAQTQINPTTQVDWTKLTGSGVPTLTCTADQYGQQYTDITASPNAQYVCGVGGWLNLISASSGSGTLSGQVPGFAVCASSATAATGPCALDFSVTTAATATLHEGFAVDDGSGLNGAVVLRQGSGTATPAANTAIVSQDGSGNGTLSNNGSAFYNIFTTAGGTLRGPLNGTDGNFSGTIAAGTTNPVAIGGATGSCTGKYANADGTGCSTATEITNGQPISPSSVTTSSFLYQPGGEINVRQFGAVCDGSTHPLSGYYSTLAAAQAVYPFVTALTQETDYAGIQKTINFLTVAPWSSGNILIPGGCLVNATVVISAASIGVRGNGWGSSQSTVGSYLKWDGTAGTPMLQLVNAWGSRIRDIRFIGDSANKPSAAINFNQQVSIPNNQNALDNVYIGAGFPDSDSGTEFVNGLLFDGIDSNDSLSVIRNTVIGGVVNGINLTQAQNSINYIESLQVNNATACGIRSASIVNGGNLYFANNAVDLCAVASADSVSGYGLFTFQNFLSELSGRMLTIVGTEGGLIVTGNGSWGVTASINADAKVIYSSGQAGREVIDLNNFSFPNEGSATVPLIDMETASGATYNIHLHNPNSMPFSSITCDTATIAGSGCQVYVDGPLGSHHYQGNTTGAGAGSVPELLSSNVLAYNPFNYQNATLGVYSQGGTSCIPFSNSLYNASLPIWEWCAGPPDTVPDAGSAGVLTLQTQTNGGGWTTLGNFARNGNFQYFGNGGSFVASTFGFSIGNAGASANYWKADDTYWLNAAGVLGLRLSADGLYFGSAVVTPAATGQRFACIDTTGKVVSSATACSGT